MSEHDTAAALGAAVAIPVKSTADALNVYVERTQSIEPVLAAQSWPSNAELIAAVARLGYLHQDWRTLDATYGKGTFWKVFRPTDLVTHDLKLDGVDFRSLPHADGEFGAVVFDPPYKLNGTPTEGVDERYGVNVVDTREGRTQLCLDGITECARVTASEGWLLVKCQDQVNGGKVRWQTREFAAHAESFGFRLVDMLHKLGGRPQPEGRRQVHARRNYSTLLVLQAPRRSTQRSFAAVLIPEPETP